MPAEITTFKDNVDLIKIDGKTIYVIGTAHISRSSADLVRQTIDEVKPDSVAVELCDSRLQSMKDQDRWKNMDLVSVIRRGKTYLLMAQLMLASFQKRLGDKLKVKPGAEMMEALKAADNVGAGTVLADRDITTTLKRTWAALGFWSTVKVLSSLVAGAFSPETYGEAEIERLKRSDALDELMSEFSNQLPEVRKTLIDERDQFLAEKIRTSPGKIIVAVVGAGHAAGIRKWIDKPINLADLEKLPPPSIAGRLFAWTIPLLIAALFVWGFLDSGPATTASMVGQWILVTGASAALGPLICLAHPLTILAAFVSAPITTLHPLLASGWVAALVEALIKKPRVSDLETITNDLTSLTGLWRNRVSKVLLIMALTNLTGTIGALIGVKIVASLIGN